MNQRDVLLKAAKYVSQGWMQNWLKFRGFDGTYSYCMIGALAEAAEDDTDTGQAALDAVAARLCLSRDHLAEWNDEPGRLAIEVEDALRDTALSLEEK